MTLINHRPACPEAREYTSLAATGRRLIRCRACRAEAVVYDEPAEATGAVTLGTPAPAPTEGEPDA